MCEDLKGDQAGLGPGLTPTSTGILFRRCRQSGHPGDKAHCSRINERSCFFIQLHHDKTPRQRRAAAPVKRS